MRIYNYIKVWRTSITVGSIVDATGQVRGR